MRKGITKKFGEVENCNIFHVRSINWTTTMVFSRPRDYGILPHPSGKWQEDLIDSCLSQEHQNELFASIMCIGQHSLEEGSADMPSSSRKNFDEYGVESSAGNNSAAKSYLNVDGGDEGEQHREHHLQVAAA